MNFQTMEYFVAVAEERSFTRAAERLSVTQQTLSAHIATVERELGVKLVNRKVPLTLTYAGEVFLGYARKFQTMQRTMVQQLRDIAQDERGLLAIGVASTRGHMIMPSAIAAYQAEHPGIKVSLVEGENKELLDLLAEGLVDMVVATVPPRTPAVVAREIYRERIVLLVARSLLADLYGDDVTRVVAEVEQSGSLAPLATCPFLLLGREDEPGHISRQILAHSGVDPIVRVRSKNSETLVDLAARGVGACFVPEDLAKLALSEHGADTFCTIGLGEEASIGISVAWKASDHVWSVVESFAALLEEQLKEGAA